MRPNVEATQAIVHGKDVLNLHGFPMNVIPRSATREFRCTLSRIVSLHVVNIGQCCCLFNSMEVMATAAPDP
jgi:hypothetical protein